MSKYSGDVNIQNGGYFFSLGDWQDGYADVVRVMPCSEGGGQDNCFWVEELTVHVPDDLSQTLLCLGLALDAQGNIVEKSRHNIVAAPGTEAFQSVVIDACVAHGNYDQDSSLCVSIGKPDPSYSGIDPVTPDLVLRSDASLDRYVRKNFL